VRELNQTIADRERQLSEAIRVAQDAKSLVTAKEKEIKSIHESNERNGTMEELLAPLNEDKQRVMKDLLESVQTSRLKNAYEKYLPAVLAESTPKAKKVISESVRAVTGDKTAPAVQENNHSNVIDIKRLAGL
jgi:hypothetical protein